MSEGICEMEEGLRKRANMESLLVIAESTFTAWAVVVGLSVTWHYQIEKEVPKPYLVRLPVSLARKAVFPDLGTG